MKCQKIANNCPKLSKIVQNCPNLIKKLKSYLSNYIFHTVCLLLPLVCWTQCLPPPCEDNLWSVPATPRYGIGHCHWTYRPLIWSVWPANYLPMVLSRHQGFSTYKYKVHFRSKLNIDTLYSVLNLETTFFKVHHGFSYIETP